MTVATHWSYSLVVLSACPEAVEWAKSYDSLDAAWAACERGDWMLWLLGMRDRSAPWSEERKPLVLCTCDCARLGLPYAGKNEAVARRCIETTEAWCRGEATREDVRAARRTAAATAYAATAYAADADAAATADAATAAAYAADAAAYAYAATAAAAADAAADSADAAYARLRVLRDCADIVRKHFPVAP